MEVADSLQNQTNSQAGNDSCSSIVDTLPSPNNNKIRENDVLWRVGDYLRWNHSCSCKKQQTSELYLYPRPLMKMKRMETASTIFIIDFDSYSSHHSNRSRIYRCRWVPWEELYCQEILTFFFPLKNVSQIDNAYGLIIDEAMSNQSPEWQVGVVLRLECRIWRFFLFLQFVDNGEQSAGLEPSTMLIGSLKVSTPITEERMAYTSAFFWGRTLFQEEPLSNHTSRVSKDLTSFRCGCWLYCFKD